MSEVKSFLNHHEEREVVEAIWRAEKITSGEIRIHLDESCEVDVMDQAAYIFDLLKMQHTRHRNAVLIYIAVKEKKIAIIGDSGVNAVVHKQYWDEIIKMMINSFRMGAYKQGLLHAVHSVAEVLVKHFPGHHADVNELSNEISYG